VDKNATTGVRHAMIIRESAMIDSDSYAVGWEWGWEKGRQVQMNMYG
jgi:hypothetical protein